MRARWLHLPRLTLSIHRAAPAVRSGTRRPPCSRGTRVSSPAGTAHARELHAAVLEREAVAFAEILGRPVNPFVFRFDHGAALAADQELPAVGMVGVVAGDKRSRAVKSVHQPHVDEEVEAAIDARGRDGGILWPNEVEQFVGGQRPVSPSTAWSAPLGAAA